MYRHELLVTRIIDVIMFICSVLVLMMLAILFCDVFARYLFNHPIIWSEEITLVILIWFGFFSISNELYYEHHMSISFLFDKLKPKTQKVVSLINCVLEIIFFFIMFYELVVITITIRDSKLPVSGLHKIIIYIPVVLSSLLMILYSVALLIKKMQLYYGKQIDKKEE